jgi:hypothetical protein
VYAVQQTGVAGPGLRLLSDLTRAYLSP